MNLKLIENQAREEIEKAKNAKDLDFIFKKYLGKNGIIKTEFSKIKKLSEEEKKEQGKELNELKKKIEENLKKKLNSLKQDEIYKRESYQVDITLPPKKIEIGHLHPLTIIERQVEEVFQTLGFEVVEGPEIENEWYNFDALNIPPDHPARAALSLGKTFYLEGGGLLRTHTSPVQVRYMEKNNPPLRIIVPGRVYRAEATDASHETNFYQVEGLMVDEDVSVANFKAIIQKFLEGFFRKKIIIRLRPSYFPFTEPSFEVDMNCTICHGKGCSACKHSGWLEMGGAGMVHPNVFKNADLNPKFWQGFAFGMSLDRLTMMRYKINDIRLFHSGDLRFLKQF